MPIITTLPVPSGLIFISPLDTEVICLPFTSKSPPNCGVVSVTNSVVSVVAIGNPLILKLHPSAILISPFTSKVYWGFILPMPILWYIKWFKYIFELLFTNHESVTASSS